MGVNATMATLGRLSHLYRLEGRVSPELPGADISVHPLISKNTFNEMQHQCRGDMEPALICPDG
jgi:hypothetical protein